MRALLLPLAGLCLLALFCLSPALHAQPRNPDGDWSIEARAGYLPSQPVRDYDFTWDTLYYNGDGNIREHGTLRLVEEEQAVLRMLVPLNKIFSLGLQGSADRAAYEAEGTYRSVTNYYSPVTSTSVKEYSYRDRNYVERYSGTLQFRIHTSGRDWNRPWGEGGSPWGRIWRPSFELGLGLESDPGLPANSISARLITPLGARLPVASWAALGFESSQLYRPSVPSLGEDSRSQALVLLLTLPILGWNGPADYGRDASPDGRPGHPVLTYHYGFSDLYRLGNLDEFRHHVQVGFPLSPRWAASLGWELWKPDSGKISFFGKPSPQYAFTVGIRWNPGAQKPVEAQPQNPQNLAPEAASPAPLPVHPTEVPQ